MQAEVVPVPELFEGSVPFRDMLRESSCSSDLIRTGCDEARVEALFVFPNKIFQQRSLFVIQTDPR